MFAVLLIIKPNREVSKKEDDVNLILTKVSMIITTKVIIIITKMLMLIMITILIISHPTGKLLTHYRTKQRTLPPVAIHSRHSPENISSKSWLPNSSPKFPHKSLHQPSYYVCWYGETSPCCDYQLFLCQKYLSSNMGAFCKTCLLVISKTNHAKISPNLQK